MDRNEGSGGKNEFAMGIFSYSIFLSIIFNPTKISNGTTREKMKEKRWSLIVKNEKTKQKFVKK